MALLLAAGCGSGGSPTLTVSPPTSPPLTEASPTLGKPRRQALHRRHRAHPRRPSHRRRRPPDPGSLPQTMQLPSARTRAFDHEMADLWGAIVADRPSEGRPAFFPELAYEQVKAIADAAGDYTGRLLADFALDVHAAHQLVAAGGAAPRLLRVSVPVAYAHWVPPGACYNRVGYYEVPNSRLVYRAGGQIRSFGIASMISWRGTWYVVHLGAVVRAGAAGVVDDPSLGLGVSAPSGTC